MGFFSKLLQGASKALQEERNRNQSRAKEYLKKNGTNLSAEKKEKLEKYINSNINFTSSFSSSGSNKSTNSSNGISLDEWERKWRSIGTLSSLSLSGLSDKVGVYNARLNGKIVYIGRAVEYTNGGFRKRLSDYTRDSDSGRKHKSGKLMYKNADDLQISIIETGSDSEAAEIAKKLEKYLIQKYSPKWNYMLKSKVF